MITTLMTYYLVGVVAAFFIAAHVLISEGEGSEPLTWLWAGTAAILWPIMPIVTIINIISY